MFVFPLCPKVNATIEYFVQRTFLSHVGEDDLENL